MSLMSNILIAYLVIINFVSFGAFGMDKQKAKKGKWRIPETTLFGVALVGGSVGALCGMYAFRHKIRKMKFVLGVPLIMALQVGIGYFVLR